MENKRSYTISIRLHSLSVKRCDDVLKSIYRDDEKSKLSSTILSKNIGKGKAYALLEQRSVPKWRDEFEHFSAGKIKIMENVYSKALVVIELKDSLKQTRFLSISFGRGNSLLDEATIVGDFGKIIAAKKLQKI